MFNMRKFFLILVICNIAVLAACSIKTPQSTLTNHFSEYYLLIKQLAPEQLQQEIDKQQADIKQQQDIILQQQASVKLLLLTALPGSPINNSFQSKVMLNDINNSSSTVIQSLSTADQALLTLLSDQLNQTILMHNQLLAQQNEIIIRTQAEQEKLANEIAALKKLIIQLTQIEQAIQDEP